MPSIKLALNSSCEAFLGKLRLGRILFNHSTDDARCLAAEDERDKENHLVKHIKRSAKNRRHRISASYIQSQSYCSPLVQKHRHAVML